MKPSEDCKLVGLKGLRHMAQLTGRHENVLRYWHKHQPELFQKALDAAVIKFHDMEKHTRGY